MTETLVETQVRFVLEQQCVELFTALKKEVDHPLTLVIFDFGGGNVAFKSSLLYLVMIGSFELLLRSWAGEPVRRRLAGVGTEDLNFLCEKAKHALPAGVGFALLIGSGPSTAYCSSANREDMTRMLEVELLPQWRNEIDRRGAQ